MSRYLVALLLVIASPAFAQQPPDITTLQRVVVALQQQRNQAMDALASAEVQRVLLAEEIEKLKAKLRELEKPPPDR
jgi:predicted  nucleic acid-binding Zn-ribbon protein